MSLFFEKRQIVTPGDLLAEGDFIAGENTYKEKGKIYSQKLGLAEVDGQKVSVVALKGKYTPKVGDLVIGQVIDMSLSGWYLDINAPYDAVLSISDVTGKAFSPKTGPLTKILDIGEIVIGKVVSFDRTRNPSITTRGPPPLSNKVEGGLIVDLTPAKIPRLIGKKGSMISMLKQETGCEIIAGQNGKVLIQGKSSEKIELAIKAIRMIEEQAHTSGLTDRIKAFLKSKRKGDESG